MVPRGVLGGVIAPSSHCSSLIEIPLAGKASWENDLYCVQAGSETPCFFNQVYSMIPSTKSSNYLYQMATGENRVGSKQREEEDIEIESSGLME